jgi:outer membrane protein insertion porin family
MGKRYRFGPVSVVQEIDSLRSPEPREDITDEIIFDHLDYAPGEYYAADKIQKSQEYLNRLGILDLRSIREIVPSRSDTSLRVPTEVTYIPRDRNELAPELILSDESGALNIGAGLGVTRRNFLGGGRTANARLRFHTQTIGEFPDYFDPAGESIATVNLTFELLQPYLFSNAVTGIWTFSGIVDKQMAYIQYILRNRLGASGKIATYTTAAFDWTLELTSLTFRPDYVELQKDPEVRLQIEQALLQPRQFNSILGFTLQRDKSNDLFSPSAGFIHSITLEESGILPVLLQRVIPDLPYTQFYRITTFGRWYIDLSGHRGTVLALKAKAGFEGKYGGSFSNDSVRIPQTHLFYGGGSNSVRGWGARQLISGGEPDLGGNLALEGSAEFRFNTFQSARDGLLDKLWLVTFLDVGNVWTNAGDFRVSDLAIAVGIGLRYDTFFGPFRLDWGFRIHDPGVTGWFTNRQIYGEVIKGGMIHFGIGHAF